MSQLISAPNLNRRRAAAWLGLAAAGISGEALAAYPDRPIKLVNPFAAGGSSDLVARILARRFQTAFGQPCIVDNRPGAASLVGTEYAARSAPDGYTIIYLSSAVTIQPALVKVPYDIQKDLQPISQVIRVPYLLTARADSRFSSLEDVVAEARKGRPVNFGSYGIGSPPHLIMEQIQSALYIKLTHIPYRTPQTMLSDAVAGLVDVIWDVPSGVLGFVKSGRLKPLATSGQERASFLPEVRALGETVPGLGMVGWGALMAPAGVPKHVIQALQKEVVVAVNQPDVAATLKAQGFIPVASTSEELARTIEHELLAWKTLIREKNIKVD